MRAALYAAWRGEARWHGGEVVEHDDLLLCATGLPAGYWNTGYVVRPPASADDVVRRAVGWFDARNLPFGVLVPDEYSDTVAPAAVGAGLDARVAVQCMVLTPPELVPAPVPALAVEVREVHTDADVDDHVSVAAEAFSSDVRLLDAFVRGEVGQPECRHLTGYVDGEPVTVAMSIRTGDVAGIYGVGTRVAWRRRGLGAALTTMIAYDALAAGCDLLYLNPSDLGHGTYRRLGFRTVAGFTAFHRP